MENTVAKASAIQIGLRFGVLIGLVGIVASFLVQQAKVSFLLYAIVLGTLSLLIAVVGIVLAHRAFKQANGGLMSFQQGVLIAVVAFVISSLLTTLYNHLYLNYIDTEFVARMKEQLTDFMERNNAPQAKIDEGISKFDEMNPPLAKGLLKGLGSGAIGGLLLGAIVSAFTKRKPADFD